MNGFRMDGNHLKISATNLPRFYELLTQAKKEAQQLHDTLGKLSCFEFDIEFSAERGQAGEMDSASDTIISIPTK